MNKSVKKATHKIQIELIKINKVILWNKKQVIKYQKAIYQMRIE